MMQDLAVSASASALSPIALFLQADIVVKSVMIGLLLASIWTWAIIVGGTAALGRAQKGSKAFEADFWKSEDIDRFYENASRQDAPAAKVFTAGVNEWRRSTKGGKADRDGTRARLASAMTTAIGEAIDRLSDRLNILATVGSVAPFVGLFGTVWGIMRSFTDIAASQNTSLGVVAPGIAEALFATALGLVAAIPAVVAYNKLATDFGRYASRLEGFATEFSAILSRQLDERQ